MNTSRPSVTLIRDLPQLAPRPADAHKGVFGRVLVVAGSRGMSGAAVLCASAALRGGAGLVRLAVPVSLLYLVAPANPCYMTAPLAEDPQGRLSEHAADELLKLIRSNTVTAFGPGLGRSHDLVRLLGRILQETNLPLVVDADGLHALIPHLPRLQESPRKLILTPHPGEFSALTGGAMPRTPEERQEQATAFAGRYQVVLVLKGQHSLITDGQRLAINSTGNPGMATGGSGDVLTGLLAALLGQGLEPFAAAQLGVHLHGLAGDLARDKLGETALIASDLLDYLSGAFLRQAGDNREPGT